MRRREEHSGMILLIEDDRHVAEGIGEFLDIRGFTVDYSYDGIGGLHLAVTHGYDAIVLDRMLPDMDGLEVCRKLRKEARRSTPILMLAACGTLDDKLLGLEAGADDYLVQPFALRELEARIRALIRRDRRQVSTEILRVGDLTLEMGARHLQRGDQWLTVSPIGLKLLAILMRESPHIVSRQGLEREVWGDAPPNSDTLRTHIYHLRRVIDHPFDSPLLHTIQSAGYRMADLQAEVSLLHRSAGDHVHDRPSA
ncbi:DNA-binding response regulator, OmpR family, contains REC and winged-helix (wHTH) domain [Dyella sp. OK004]|uniref:response regulator transcription factor n=1 Tax=Dyella sp. OK004 TaxID=1855292 RepID=UPI0008E32987|nr:response regulator transcription factor [Dyella sp. OK004]SFS14013.1 DNA-binding response regulator, OmpR family, contains REC and winged-helix (wHTH) domain [Dyella sp. OK004]